MSVYINFISRQVASISMTLYAHNLICINFANQLLDFATVIHIKKCKKMCLTKYTTKYHKLNPDTITISNFVPYILQNLR